MHDDVAQYLNDAVLQGAEQFRKKKETAILVMMFIDMVHSTAMRETMGEIQFEELRRAKKQEFTAIIEQEQHGEVIKDIGDGLLSVFAIPDVAVRRALDIQKNLVEHPTFQVRIGLDMGAGDARMGRGNREGCVRTPCQSGCASGKPSAKAVMCWYRIRCGIAPKAGSSTSSRFLWKKTRQLYPERACGAADCV